MIFDIISFVKEVVNLSYDIYAARYLHKENKEIALNLHKKLRTIEGLLHGCREQDEDLFVKITSDIASDLLSVKGMLDNFINTSGGVRKFRNMYMNHLDNQCLESALATCRNCQSRVEAVSMISLINSKIRFAYAVRDVQQLERTIDDLAETPNDIINNIGTICDAVNCIPVDRAVPHRNTKADSPHSMGDGAKFFGESIDDKELDSVECFTRLPSAVVVLMREAARAGSSSTYTLDVLNCIDRLWKNWRLNEKDIQYEHRNNRPCILGKGTSGVVHAATYRASLKNGEQKNLYVAVKEIEIECSRAGEWLREFFLQLSLKNDYILPVFGVCWPHDLCFEGAVDVKSRLESRDGDGDVDGKALVVMERMTCNLRKALRKRWVRTSAHRFCVLHDVCKALLYLHERGIVHRDLKPENVLLRVEGEEMVGVAKLADFGCSRRIYDERMAKTFTSMSAAQGTTLYIPPEVLENSKECRTRKSWDVWAYGVLICYIFSPCDVSKWSLLEVMNLWRKGEFVQCVQTVASEIKDERFKSIAQKCLSVKEEDRPSMSEIYRALENSRHGNIREVLCEEHVLQTQKINPDQNRDSISDSPLTTLSRENENGKTANSVLCAENDLVTLKMEHCKVLRSNDIINEIDEKLEKKDTETSRKLVDGGELAAKMPLGFCYEKGIGEGLNVTKAVESDRSVSDEDCPKAKAYLGVCYEYGVGVERNLVKAVELYREAVDGGYLRAKSYLGACYEDGAGVEQDIKKAMDLYTDAADGGDLAAKTHLGFCYARGIGVNRDARKAIKLFCEAAEEKYLRAKIYLGICYEKGVGVEQDTKRAVALYFEAADGGDLAAKTHVGFCYEKGIGVNRDATKAAEFYKEAADGGYLRAKIHLGDCHKNGVGVEQNVGKAIELFKVAADGEDLAAKTRVAVCFEKGIGMDQDLTRAVKLYREAADKGYLRAKLYLGVCYEKGVGLDRDVNKAVQLFTEAADGGHCAAKTHLGFCFERGIGVDRNAKKAVELYREAANGGFLRAKCFLGICFKKGMGVDLDVKQAVNQFKEAADGGDLLGAVHLGFCYEKGNGVDQDKAKAVELYREAADRGYLRAKIHLALCYEKGIGVERDFKKAAKLYKEASDGGFVTVQNRVAAVKATYAWNKLRRHLWRTGKPKTKNIPLTERNSCTGSDSSL